MNIGLYQSAASLSALERWQDAVAQNINSAQNIGYRKRTVEFSSEEAGALQADPRASIGSDSSQPAVFPRVQTGINFIAGETQPTRRELDVAIQGDGFFEVKLPDGSNAYTRDGEFRLRSDRTLVTASGAEVLGDGGTPIVLMPGYGAPTINRDGSIFQGEMPLGHLAVQNFSNPTALIPIAGGMFVPAAGNAVTPVNSPELLQGYLEASNVAPMREMVDLVVISRAYEANQRIITAVDEQMGKTLDALG